MKQKAKRTLQYTFRSACKLLLWDWSTLLLFELFYKLAALGLAFPLLREVMVSAFQEAGLSYVTLQNFTQLLQSPLALLLLLLSLLLLAFYVFIEMTAIILYCQAATTGNRYGAFGLFKAAVKRAFAICKLKNLTLIPFVLVVMPLTGLPFLSGLMSSVKVPEFILEYIRENPWLNFLYILLLLALSFLLFQWIFSLHFVTLEGKSFRQAHKESRALQKKRTFRTFFCYVRCFLTMFLGAVLLYVAAIALTFLWIRLFENGSYAATLAWERYNTLRSWSSFLASAFGFSGSFAILSAIFFRYREPFEGIIETKRFKRRGKKAWLSFTAKLLLIVLLLDLYSIENMLPTTYIIGEDEATTTVTAHRAGAYYAPENTLAALDEAIKAHCAYAEIDVQQTSDGHLIVMHDANYQRTTGVDKNVWDVPLAEARTFDAGSHFSTLYRGQKIPTLEEMLNASRGKIKLMIELKSTGHEHELEKKTVELISQLGMEKQCIVASMDHDILKRVKALAPEITTAYIAAVALGDFYDMEGVDVYSIEASFVTARVVDILNFYEKPLFAWTANTEASIKRLIELEVDSIVTDNPYYVDYLLENRGRNLLVEAVINHLFPTEAQSDQPKASLQSHLAAGQNKGARQKPGPILSANFFCYDSYRLFPHFDVAFFHQLLRVGDGRPRL